MRKHAHMVEAWEASVLQHFELQGNKGLRPISARQLESLPDEYELPTF